MAATESIRPKGHKVPCPHCHGGYATDIVETSFDVFEEEFIECPMCLGTGRKMTKAERIRGRA